MEITKLKAGSRDRLGTRATRNLRETGYIPAVIYGHGEKPEHVSLSLHDVQLALAHGARTMELDQKGKSSSYLIKDVQYDYRQAMPIHLDLARVDMTERVRVEVGIELRGTPKGASEGGVLEQYITHVEVECLVSDIPDTLHPLVTELALGNVLLIKDLHIPPGVTMLSDPEDRIAAVREVTVAATEETPAEEGVEAAEPERIGRVRKDEDEEGEKD